MSNILIAGGTGMIGKSLTRLLLDRGHTVTILTRKMPESRDQEAGVNYAAWDLEKQTIDPVAVQQADAIVHLAGEGIADKRWSAKRKKEIQNSRTLSSALILKALKEQPNEVRVLVSASAIGWYEPTAADPKNSKPRVETDPSDPGFLGETCRLWEASVDPAEALGIRLVKFRTGIVLSNEGGAFPSFKKPVRLGIAAILGSGRQIVSWIHIEDLCRLYCDAIEQESLRGVYNAVAPKPVDNKTLTVTLATRMKGKFYIPFYVPVFLLKWILGEMSVEVLKSVEVSAGKIKKAGFQFLFPGIESAIDNLVKK